jgi:hypothetical protein
LLLSPHFHLVALDGVFVEDAAHQLRFIEDGQPSKLDVAEIVSGVHARVHAELQRLGLEEQDQDGEDPLASASPALAACYAGSVTRRSALGPHAGSAIARLGAQPSAPWVERDKPHHGHYEGFDLHADVAIGADDRQGLSQLLRYGARSAVAGDRLRLTQDGRVALTLKRRHYDGTSQLVFEPTTFIERLAALVPRPHKNLTVYGGVLAPNAKLRSQVVVYGSVQLTKAPVAATRPEEEVLDELPDSESGPAKPQPAVKRPRSNYTWAQLMLRTFAMDVLACQHCGGRLRLLGAVMSPKAVLAILVSLGLPTDAPELRPARAPPEQFDSA